MKKLLILLTPFLVYTKAVKVDDILTDTHKVKIETTLAYTNIKKMRSLLAPIRYQTLNGDFATIPIFG